jgi:hypothetical protein
MKRTNRKLGGRALFRKRPKPLMSKKRLREAKLRAAATRRVFITLVFSTAVVAVLFVMLLSVPPQISPEQLAANIKAQRVHRITPGSSSGATAPDPTRSSSNSASGTRIAKQIGGNPSNYSLVSFEKLSGFRFFVTDQMVDKASDPLAASWNCLEQIPDEVRALNDKGVSVSGYMLPMKYEGKLTTEFLLLRNQSLCCYGMPPKITEWVNVRVAGKGVRPIMDVPVTVSGLFHVGDVREQGELVGIYSLDAQKVKGPRE